MFEVNDKLKDNGGAKDNAYAAGEAEGQNGDKVKDATVAKDEEKA